MAVAKITEARAQRAQSEGPQCVWDSELKGFGLVVRPTRRVSLVIQKNIEGRKTRNTIGYWPTLRIEEARKLARVRLAEIESGVVIEKPTGGMTLREAAAEHERDMIADGRSSHTLLMGELERHMPDWLDRPLAHITAQECKQKHRELAAIPSTANRAFRIFRAVWNTARPLDDLGECPTHALRWYYIPSRTGRIEDLKDWHNRVDGISNPVVRDWLRFKLGTGLRLNDALRVKLSEVDFDKGTLRRPSPKGGTRMAFEMPLSTQLMEIMERRREWGGAWAFPSLRQDGPMTNPKKSMAHAGLCTVTHDIRRTFSSVALAQGVPQPMISLLMNHRIPGMTGQYQHLMVEELRPWQQRISDALFARE